MNRDSASFVTISIGSNINREFHIRQAVSALRNRFGKLVCSPVYETAAVGFDGEDFLNLAVSFQTYEDVFAVVAILKEIEDGLGRDRSQPRFSSRKIDLDLLTYDDMVINEQGVQIPRHEIQQNAFVLKPLSDLLADQIHPELGQSYARLWNEMKRTAGRIDVYELDLF